MSKPYPEGKTFPFEDYLLFSTRIIEVRKTLPPPYYLLLIK